MEFYWLCFIILRCLMVVSGKIAKEEFISCKSVGDSFDVTFNCASLYYGIQGTQHTNYFDKHVMSDTCETQYGNNKIWKFASLIVLTNCKIPIMPRHFLQHLGHVKKIDFGRSEIKSIDSGMFSNDSSLTEMRLSWNGLTELPGYLFSQTPNIKEIDISYNRISNIDANTFRGPTKNLSVINLSHNNIETVEKTLFMDCLHLAELNFGYNFIEDFQVDLSELHELKLLRLDNNNIKRLDCTIFELSTKSIFIDVDHNHIEKIEFNCGALNTDSIKLSINYNQLTTLTFPKVDLLKGFTTIYAAHNLIENIAFQGNFYQLTQLDLNANHLKNLAAWRDTQFPKLARLNINGNQFNCSYLKNFLKKLPKTVQLDQMELESLKTSKTIHGINCNGDAFNLASDVAYVSYWYLITFLILTVVIL